MFLAFEEENVCVLLQQTKEIKVTNLLCFSHFCSKGFDLLGFTSCPNFKLQKVSTLLSFNAIDIRFTYLVV